MDASLLTAAHKQQINTWNFLWQFIKLADKFVSHPIPGFVPPKVKKSKLVYWPPSTDPLDGLNKPVGKFEKEYYWGIFNNHLKTTGQTALDPRRPYLIQIARFDPSKGIPDVIESYRKLRRRLIKAEITPGKMPQLLIAGNGSVDDPEGSPIYEEAQRILNMDTYRHLKDDVKLARLPHHDQLLNILLADSWVALQLSHKEGFEFKVTEALMKGKPTIAYRAGGIPLQIRHAKTGYLVKPSNTSNVANYAYKLFMDKNLYRQMSETARATVNHDYWTINNAARWLALALELTGSHNAHI